MAEIMFNTILRIQAELDKLKGMMDESDKLADTWNLLLEYRAFCVKNIVERREVWAHGLLRSICEEGGKVVKGIKADEVINKYLEGK